MGTPSFEFLGFSLVVILLFNALDTVWWRQSVLLTASLIFLGFFSQSLTAWGPFVAFMALGYICLRFLQNGASRSAFASMIVGCIVVFAWLKKYTFLPPGLWLEHPYITLGLSYIFFRLLHLLIDAHGAQLPNRVSVVSYLTYTLNFTTLLSGPIQTYQQFESYQLAPVRLRLDIFDGGRAIERIIIGFFKVNVLSLMLSLLQTQALSDLHGTADWAEQVWLGIEIVGIYPLYLYCNFSGYIDVVIGIARFLRIELPENFNRPFSAGNFMVFWGRWHITLSEWLKTYVYNPLLIASMRRFQNAAVAPYLSVFAIFVTFFLVGLWHGQTSEFLFFGVLQGGGVAGVQLYQTVMVARLGRKRYRALAGNGLYAACTRGLTFAWFAFTLLWFWSNWAQINSIASILSPTGAITAILILAIGASLVLALWEAARNVALRVRMSGEPTFSSRYVRVVIGTACAVISVAIVELANAPAPDLVYKAF